MKAYADIIWDAAVPYWSYFDLLFESVPGISSHHQDGMPDLIALTPALIRRTHPAVMSRRPGHSDPDRHREISISELGAWTAPPSVAL